MALNPTLLQSIIAFPTVPPSRPQSLEGVRGLVDLVGCFVNQLQQESWQPAATRALWPALEPQDLEALAVAAAAAGNSQALTWFPDFGAALLALEPGPDGIQPGPGTLALHLLCLDSWDFVAHSSPDGIQHTAVTTGHTLLSCGHVSAEDLGQLVQRVRAFISLALAKRKEGEKGFQRTPALIRSAVEAAIGAVERGDAEAPEVITSRGGFTDVGQHTGGDTVRDTCWPLVRSVLQVLLARAPGCAPASPPALLFRWALAHLELWLLQSQMRRLAPDTAGPVAVTNAVHMLESAARKAAALADDGHDVSAFEAACASARACIEEAVAQRALWQAKGFELPAEGSPSLTGKATSPTGTLPQRLQPRTEEGGLEAARQRAALNLGSVPVFQPWTGFYDLLSLLRNQQEWSSPADDVQYQLVLRSVEEELFRRAAAGFDSAESSDMDEEYLEDLEEVVDLYRSTLQRFLETPAAKTAAAEGALLRAELHSRELLVVWVAYCLIHTDALRQYGVTVPQYGVALSYKDLRHLVLSDRAAVDAALAVAAHLQRWTKPGREVFSLRDGGSATFQLAREVAGSSLQHLWEQEQADATARRDEHWAEVKRKQAEAKQLRDELSQLQAEGAALQRKTVSGKDGAVQLRSTKTAPHAQHVGPQHVDHFSGPSDGVWHPDGLPTCMAWAGSGAEADGQLKVSGFFNPFRPVPAADVETFYTAALPTEAEGLQWAVHTPEKPSPERGNWTVASQDLRPPWLDKPAFLAFGSLRSFPLRQLWRLCVALRERTLPLGHPAVHVLVRQLLYHIGTLTDEQPPQPLWRIGWDEEPNGVLPTLCGELEALAEQLDPSPREHEAVMLLGPAAAYVASFHPPCRAVARRFAAMTSRVADELQEDIAQHAGDERLSAALQAKQCRWRAMSLLCYDSDALTEAADAAAMARLMVLVNHGRVFLPDPALLAQGEALQLRAHNVIARRIDFLVGAAKEHPAMLTAAVGAVLRGRNLSGLQWAQLEDSDASFEAVGPDGRLYSLNLLDGTVLFDGWPPSRLPKEVTQHPLYARTFGGWSFEVAGGAEAGAASTRHSLRPVGGRLYEFTSGQGGQSLVVTEVDVERRVRLELLDVGEDHGCGEWGKQLPRRLRELYSHWLCRERGVIVLRPPNFQEHDAHFVITCRTAAAGAASSSGPVLYDCRRVPPHLQRLHWADLLTNHRAELTDRLVLLRGCSVRDTLLAKVEDTSFLHCFRPAPEAQRPDCLLLFELPRYGLEFELRSGGELASRDYPGYRLRRRQLLVDTGSDDGGYGSDGVSYTLPGFQQYLVLEHSPAVRQLLMGQRADELVLIPAGPVVRNGGKVAVVTSSGSGARLKAHCYEVHGRFGHLRASAVLPRLQLAALYAATGTLLPEPASRATGRGLPRRRVPPARLSGAAPCVGPLDLAVAAWRPEVLRQFNPFLSEEVLAGLRKGVLTWLTLCVLEDRLGRLVALAEAGEEYRTQLVQELLVRRVWDVRAHPQWLVFEAEGRLQIRPQQYAVAAHLMDPANAGAIAQLNMGEGKTRVILPMLAMHWADGSRVVRLNFLSTLLDEAYGHLHAHLTASVLSRKLFTLPFHRDVELTQKRVQAMASAMRHCQKDGGLVLVAPEHRLSLLLKRAEMGFGAEAGEEEDRQGAARCCSALDELSALPYMDVLDESDELLHHRFQLIYACGAPMGLPAAAERAGMVQALLAALSRLAASDRLPRPEGAAVLEPPSAASAQLGAQPGPHPPLPPPGSFCGLRLLPGEALNDEALWDLRHALAMELASHPPLQLHWLREHPLKAHILACILDVSQPAEELLGPDAAGSDPGQLTPDRMSQVLALRGLLGCGVLEHGLQKRHRVDFGVDRSTAKRPAQPPGTRGRTRMAVPFRAAHVPSERSEFAQPDVALLLTHLSYYQDGLSAGELQAALAKLLAMGPSARRYDYEERWLPLARDRIAEEHLPLLDSAAKLDPGNPTQMQLLHFYFSHNTATVDFWLTYSVLPTETRQFPQRLATSAWHLAGGGGGGVVGFSGTNDNHRLLPLQVHKAEPEEPSLAATNGKMLHVILEQSLGFTTLPAEGGGLPAWQALLDTALALQRRGVELSALIDCGALLAGTSNRAAAAYLLSRLDRGRYRGVTYFDEGERSWVVEDRQGRRAPRHASPIPEADTFVLFDDARCRGADLKLRLGAVGLLTLGPDSTKDKVMQAAGRLRQLGRGQKLWLTAAPDVSAKIRSGSGAAAGPALDARPRRDAAEAVLRWVMANTVDATLAGVQAWADQGLTFAASGGVPQPTDEVLELADFYGGSKGLVPVAQAVEALAEAKQGGMQADLVPAAEGGGVQQYAAQIVERSTEYGEGHMVVAGGRADEECERELEEAEEEEAEVEQEVPRVTPRKETTWNLAAALAGSSTALSPASLAAAAGVNILTLPSAVRRNLTPDTLHGIPWSTKVYATVNFLVTANPKPSPLNEYLRPLDALVLFPGSREALLVSEPEADRLLGALWQRRRRDAARGGPGSGPGPSNARAPVLVSLCYLRDAWASGAVPRLAVSLETGATFGGPGGGPGAAGAAASASLGPRALVSMQLLNGEASYARGAARREVRDLMMGRREEAEALVGIRGKGVALPKSDLERAVEGAGEDG
ncbi:hypothetical protein HYH03_001073 [Edaphochlamys debaryana]|uniref:ubiquitinyl hydrolase 1 n=1 Tax=Edaphochlamys debaryana TaxID=47281 RepID=A0A836C708_9CHLO|nr:hypothetical protein HYH03_001073 [Edaphochlamys debaryana]|eukprot:KAG2501267.1 hypothetical protein HYH03_001073 [Edaphochlamys debaryana]